jgi:hypothetical protein
VVEEQTMLHKQDKEQLLVHMDLVVGIPEIMLNLVDLELLDKEMMEMFQ